MKNRAKCKLCNDILESFHRHDYVECKCKEISIDGGSDYFRAGAKNWDNFIRLDDNDKEIPIKVYDSEEKLQALEEKTIDPPNREEKIAILKGMIDSYERLPQSALISFCTNADLAAALMLVYEILKD